MLARERIAAGLLVVGLALSLAACSAADPEGDATRAAELSVLDTDELGEILVDGEGNVLYMFVPDEASRVTCTFTCASNWPPLTAIEGELPAAGEGVDPGLIGTLANPAGGEVITYNDWPLYRYAADRTPGEHRGQDRYLNGGVWLVMQPDGEPLEQ
jgi:predicted lipoprotein with Yx(FWY)xxD motif